LKNYSPNDDLQRDATMPLGKMTYRSRKTATPLRISFWTMLRSHRYNDRGETLFEQPGPNTPIKYQYQRKKRANSMASAMGRNSINS